MGGNIGESHSQLLGGHFSLMMLVHSLDSPVALRERLRSDVEGMTTLCFSAAEKKLDLSPRIGCELCCSHTCACDVSARNATPPLYRLDLMNVTTKYATVAGNFRLSGADNPGIVHKLTSVLARNSLTIKSMKTIREEAPFGGTELFTSKPFSSSRSALTCTLLVAPANTLTFPHFKWKAESSLTNPWHPILIFRG